MASQADSRVAYPGRDSSVFSKLLHAKYGHSTFILACLLRVSRVASGPSRRSWHVRYAFNSDPIGASQRSVAMCHQNRL
jgi:hypothetical protein